MRARIPLCRAANNSVSLPERISLVASSNSREESDRFRWYNAFSKGVTGLAFEKLARQHGVSVYGSERFAVGKEAPIAAARLAVCAPESPEELEQGLIILKQLLDILSKK